MNKSMNTLTATLQNLFDGKGKVLLTKQKATDMSSPTPEGLQKMYCAKDSKMTKVVATIGPATEGEPQLHDLILAGMNVARFNTKHNQPDWHKTTIERVRKVAEELSTPVGILLDLQGPEIRITLPNEQASFDLKKDDFAFFTSEEHPNEQNSMMIPQNVVLALDIGNHVILDDGVCEFVVTEKTATQLKVQAQDNFTVKTRKTMNTPGVILDMPSLLPTDLHYLDELKDIDPEFIGLSFVRDEKDITILREELQKRNMHSDIIAKIENQKGLDNIDSILQVSDGIMVARGDLAVEVDFAELTYWQKFLIHKAMHVGKPVITATQMLMSMTQNPRPSRAEMSDVANTVYDGTDCLMLSEETTIGKYPTKCIETFTKIALFYEKLTPIFPAENIQPGTVIALAQTTQQMVADTNNNVQKIVLICDDTTFIRQLSRYRLHVPIIAITATKELAQKLTLSYGVSPMCITHTNFSSLSVNNFLDILKNEKKLLLGEKVIIIYTFSQQEEINNLQPVIQEVV